jgi:hypothetical protein
MSGPMGALGGAWPMIRGGVSHKVIDDVSVTRDHVSKDGRQECTISFGLLV